MSVRPLERVQADDVVGDGSGGDPDVDVVADVDAGPFGEPGRDGHLVATVDPGAVVDRPVDHDGVGLETDQIDLPAVDLADRLDRRFGGRISGDDGCHVGGVEVQVVTGDRRAGVPRPGFVLGSVVGVHRGGQ